MPSRRDVVCGLAGAALGLGGVRFPHMVEAKKRRKKVKKPKSPKPNAYGCLDVGAACKNGDQCCSGVCEGKTCRAHHASICHVGYDLCTTGAAHICGVVNEVGTECACTLTTGNAPFCGHFDGSLACQECSKDADCEELRARAACVVVGAGICEGICTDTGGRACVAPCPTPAK